LAITEKYVSVAGGGAHDGTSEANAYTLSEAITANNALGAGGAAGLRYNIINGAYTARGATDTISVGGSATSPAIWRGYNSAIGDLDNGTRDAYGVLTTTNFPDIGYNATFRLAVSAGHVVLSNLDMAFNVSGSGLLISTTNVFVLNCRMVTTSTNAAATAATASSDANFTNCDFATAGSGGSACVQTELTAFLSNCRATSPGATGYRLTQNARATLVNCTAYDCGVAGFSAAHANTYLRMFNCTAYSCVNGVDILSTNNRDHIIVGCMFTDNSGFGIDLNAGGSGAFVQLAGTRFRDNGANFDATYDWITGTGFRTITTDTGGATTDYADPTTNKDFSLVYSSPGFAQGFSQVTNLGACGFTVPTPAQIGAAAWNNTTSPSRTLT